MWEEVRNTMHAHRNFDDIKPFIKNKKVLDIGAAAGLCILPFTGKGSIGLDTSPQGKNVIYGEASNFKLKEKFDVITMCSLIEHFPSKAHVLKSFKNAHHHLRDDGLLIIQCPHAFDTGAWYDFAHELAFTHHSVMQGLERAGFKVEDAWTHPRFPLDQHIVRRFGIIKVPISSDYIIKLLATFNLVRDVVVVARKKRGETR